MMMCLIMVISLVNGQALTWTGKKCGVDNQGLYDTSLRLATCNDYCKSINWHSGKCTLNQGYGECLCELYQELK